MDSRQEQLAQWCSKQTGIPSISLTPVSGDASFRRYFRFTLTTPAEVESNAALATTSASELCGNGRSFIAMDAPPEKEDSSSFIAIAQSWHEQGIQVPAILAQDLDLGFILLDDFADELLLNHLWSTQQPDAQNTLLPNQAAGEKLYQQAFDALLGIQQCSDPSNYSLPSYDSALLQREMSLFTDWLVDKKLQLQLNDDEQAMLESVFRDLEANALAQDQVCVHRDYHSRNLMLLDGDRIGVIDFQDAVKGPITYDLVSLLRDCYIAWPDEDVNRWQADYYARARELSLTSVDSATFKRWFDWMGMQRHLKAAGIFARLSLRDGKHGYLKDVPRTVNYLVQVAKSYESMQPFSIWLQTRVQPLLASSDFVESP